MPWTFSIVDSYVKIDNGELGANKRIYYAPCAVWYPGVTGDAVRHPLRAGRWLNIPFGDITTNRNDPEDLIEKLLCGFDEDD